MSEQNKQMIAYKKDLKKLTTITGVRRPILETVILFCSLELL